jgi:zinc protease
MTVLLKENHNLPLVNITLYVGMGSGREGKFSGSGISHFTEHMVFNGTRIRGAGDVFKEIESYGGSINAFTSFDTTGYKITLPEEFIFPALKILADMVMNAAFDVQQLEKEKQVVLKEIKLNYDNPQKYASRLLWEKAYSTHPYRYPVIGREESFEKLTRDDLVEFHQTAYVPNNMVLAVVGDIEEEKALTFVRNIFGDFKSKEIPPLKNTPEPQQKQLREHQEEFTSALTYLYLGFHSVDLTHRDCYALDVLGTILGEGDSSRLYELICSRKNLAYSIDAINYTPREPGLFLISCLLDERQRKKVLALIFKEIELVKNRRVSEAELESAKNKIVSDILFSTQTIEAQAREMVVNKIITGNIRFTERYIRRIEAVTFEDILRVAKKYLNKENLSIVALTPRDKRRLSRGEERNISLAFDPSAGLSGQSFVNHAVAERPLLGSGINGELSGEIKKYVLDNGLTVLVRENRDLPLISMKAVFKGGLRAETKGTNGLCNLTAHMLGKATKTKNAEEIADLIESKGARLGAFSGNNSFGLSLDLVSRDFDRMMLLFSELIIKARFPQKEFTRQKKENLAALQAQEDDIFQSGGRFLKSTLFERHPYAFDKIGSEKSLRQIRVRDLAGFYRKFCVAKNMVLVIFGDVSEKEAVAKAKKYFADLNSGASPVLKPAKEPAEKHVRTEHKFLNKKQSLLLMGFYGTTVFSEDRFILEAICQLLSQGSGKLFTQIREKAGLAYTLGAYSVVGLDPGYIVIYVATTDENVGRARETILKQLELLKREPLTEEEMSQIKRSLIGSTLISRQTNSACAMESSLDELYGLGYDYYLEYAGRINSLTPADIQRCAGQYFDLNNYSVIVVGPDK